MLVEDEVKSLKFGAVEEAMFEVFHAVGRALWDNEKADDVFVHGDFGHFPRALAEAVNKEIAAHAFGIRLVYIPPQVGGGGPRTGWWAKLTPREKKG